MFEPVWDHLGYHESWKILQTEHEGGAPAATKMTLGSTEEMVSIFDQAMGLPSSVALGVLLHCYCLHPNKKIYNLINIFSSMFLHIYLTNE